MIIDEDGNSYLYDLEKDISEQNNIALDFPEITNDLRLKINQWNEKTISPIFLGLSNNELYNKLNPDRFSD